MSTYKNNVVWITGASSGIGKALAYEFSGEGEKLVLSARRESELQRVKQNCADNKENVLVLPLDLTDTIQVHKKVEHVLQHFG